MRPLAVLLCASVACQAPQPPRPQRPPPTGAEIEGLAKGSNALAFDLYAGMRAREGNIVFSPLSISMGLVALWPGARGETAAQIQRVLYAPGGAERAAWVAGHLARTIREPRPGLTMSLASRVFAEKTSQFERAYLDLMEDAWGVPLGRVDFLHGAEKSRGQINGWVAEMTQGRFREIIPPGGIGGDTRLVSANAIYFLGKWSLPFRKVHPAPFHLTRAAEKDVPMMHQVEHFRFASVDGLKLLQMRYDAEGFDMTLLLPDEIDGLDGVERRLSPEALKGWLAQLGPRKVAVWLPRFEIRPQALRLRDALEALGMPLAFDRNAADFTGIASAEPAERRLYLGDMLHQAFVKVDEAGTEAAAATVSIVALLGSPPPMAEFRADHPFLFLLRHAPSGAILFMGRMSDPMPTVHARPSGAVGSAPPPVPPLRPRSLLDYLRGP